MVIFQKEGAILLFVHFHEKVFLQDNTLKKHVVSNILELHFEVVLKKLGIYKQDIVVGGIR